MARRKASKRRAALLGFLLGSLALGGCSFFKSLVGRNYVDLTGADVQSMAVDLRKPQKTICPRERVQMAVFLEARLEGEDQVAKLETWQGSESRNDQLDFAEFAFHSSLGSFDEEGWFTPNPDLLASVDQEFAIRSVYKARPDKFTMHTRYKPDYACVRGSGRGGSAGSAGSAGAPGNAGEWGRSGSSTEPGGSGGSGGPGGPGSNGSDGGDGPGLRVYATLVSTEFYDKLVAIRIEGEHTDFLLVEPEQVVTLSAPGGPGGPGGSGGPGGAGGNGGSGNPGGSGGEGGPGGAGGKGGNGGRGGDIALVYDSRYPQLADMVRLEVGGGAPGAPGPGGASGSGGVRGAASGQDAQPGQDGARGAQGPGGAPGSPGADGKRAVDAGDVSDRFRDLHGVWLYGEKPAAEATEDDGAKT